MSKTAGLKLRHHDGRWEWAAFTLQQSATGAGWEMWTPCDFGEGGGHWLAPDPRQRGRITVQPSPYRWPSVAEALAAQDAYERQEAHAEHQAEPDDLT